MAKIISITNMAAQILSGLSDYIDSNLAWSAITNLVETSAGVVLYRETGGKYIFLLLHYPAGHWDFVKGHLESGETAMQAAVRELQEETGISGVNIVEGFRQRIKYSYRFGGKIRLKQVTFFLASTDTDRVRLSCEHQNYLWCRYKQAHNQVTYKNARSVLRHAYRFLNSKQ